MTFTLDFDLTRGAGDDVAQSLEQRLNRPGYRCRPITLGLATDRLPQTEPPQILRALLRLLHQYRHPVIIHSCSADILEHLDILEDMACRQLCAVTVNLCSSTAALCAALEPGTPTPEERLALIQRLQAHAIPAGIAVRPLIPKINDQELEPLLDAGYAAGARFALWHPLRLQASSKQDFRSWLIRHFPRKAEHVLSLLQQDQIMAEQKKRKHLQMTKVVTFTHQIEQRFQQALQHIGYPRIARHPLCCQQFSTPARSQWPAQLNLFCAD